MLYINIYILNNICIHMYTYGNKICIKIMNILGIKK